MGALIGGIIALIVGLIFFSMWWAYLVKALLPLILIGGGALATYLGVEELRDKASQTENFGAAYSGSGAAAQDTAKNKTEPEEPASEPEPVKAKSKTRKKTAKAEES